MLLAQLMRAVSWGRLGSSLCRGTCGFGDPHVLPKPGLLVAKQRLGLLLPKARAAALPRHLGLVWRKQAGGCWTTLPGILGSLPLTSSSPGALSQSMVSEMGQTRVCFPEQRLDVDGGSARPSAPFQKQSVVAFCETTQEGNGLLWYTWHKCQQASRLCPVPLSPHFRKCPAVLFLPLSAWRSLSDSSFGVLCLLKEVGLPAWLASWPTKPFKSQTVPAVPAPGRLGRSQRRGCSGEGSTAGGCCWGSPLLPGPGQAGLPAATALLPHRPGPPHMAAGRAPAGEARSPA